MPDARLRIPVDDAVGSEELAAEYDALLMKRALGRLEAVRARLKGAVVLLEYRQLEAAKKAASLSSDGGAQPVAEA
jgi:hypothetical protein